MTAGVDNSVNLANTAAQFQQARMLAAQSAIMQAQLNVQSELVHLEKQKNRRDDLERQARQQLIDIEFEFRNICNLSDKFPLYSYYYCEHMFRIIASNDYFNRYLSQIEDIRLARETAAKIEIQMRKIATKHSRKITSEYTFYSQGMANMSTIEETLSLVHSTVERKIERDRDYQKYTDRMSKSWKKGIGYIIGTITVVFSGMILFNNTGIEDFFEKWCFLYLALVGFFILFFNRSLDEFSNVNKYTRMIDSVNNKFEREQQRIEANTALLGFRDHTEINEWLSQNEEFFSTRNPY
ncbi:hypothetical protein N9M68_02435 [Candidatus Poseidonia alphae]|nr:hypothetical protein [Candidatus Poseidonia alphae]